MPVEAATFISSLDANNPLATDEAKFGDDHLRLIKTILKATFPNADHAIEPGELAGDNIWTDTNEFQDALSRSSDSAAAYDPTASQPTSGATLILDATANNNDVFAQILARIRTSSQVAARIVAGKDSSNDASFWAFVTKSGGNLRERVRIMVGLYSYNAPGGDKGLDTFNFESGYLTSLFLRDGSQFVDDVDRLKIVVANDTIEVLGEDGTTSLLMVNETEAFIPAVYTNTSSSSANVFVDTTGELLRSVSARKFKRNIQPIDMEMSLEALRGLAPVYFQDKVPRSVEDKIFAGFVADDVAKLPGAEPLIFRDENGEVEGLAYDRITTLLVHGFQNLDRRLARLEAKL